MKSIRNDFAFFDTYEATYLDSASATLVPKTVSRATKHFHFLDTHFMHTHHTTHQLAQRTQSILTDTLY